MAQKRTRQSDNAARIYDWSGGENNAVNPALLNDNESAVLENYILDDKGTLFPRKGATPRYASAFDTSPVAGMEAFYRSDGVSKLLIGTESGKLYVDTPHLVNGYDSKDEWETGKLFGCLAHVDGKVRVMRMKDGFESGTFDDWHVRDTGWTVVSSPVKTGTKAAQATTANQKLTRELGHNAVQTYVCVYAYFGENNQDHFPVKLISPSGTEIQAVVAASDGHFKYHNGTALTNFPTDKTYVASTWYKIEVYHSGGTFWVWIDDVCLTPSGLTMKDTANSAQSQIAKVTIQNAGTDAASMTVDDVEISSIPAVFSRPSVAYKSDGTQVAANVPRFEAGKFSQAWFGEEGTTNLLTENQSNVETDMNGLWCIYGTGSRDATVAWNGGASYKGVASSTTIMFISVGPLKPSVVAGHTYTFSVYLRGQANANARIQVALAFYDSGGILVGSVAYSPEYVVPSVWTRYAVTATAPTGAVTADCIVYLKYPAINDVLWWDGAQFEAKPYATSWTLGGTTRVAETLTIPTAGVLSASEGAIDCWVYVNDYLKTDYGSTKQMFYWSTATGRISLGWNVGGYWYAVVGNGTNNSLVAISDTLSVGWHFFTMRWSATELALLIDGGAQKATAVNPYLPSSISGSAYIGCTDSGSYVNSLIDDLRISSRARTDAEIAAAYASGQPLAVDADTTYKMAFDGTLDYGYQPAWVSPIIDASQATDKASGHAGLTADIPGSASVTIQSRSTADLPQWSFWVDALPNGDLQHSPEQFVQVRLLLNQENENEPVIDKLTVSFDGTPSVTLLASDFTAGGQFYFAVLQRCGGGGG